MDPTDPSMAFVEELQQLQAQAAALSNQLQHISTRALHCIQALSKSSQGQGSSLTGILNSSAPQPLSSSPATGQGTQLPPLAQTSQAATEASGFSAYAPPAPKDLVHGSSMSQVPASRPTGNSSVFLDANSAQEEDKDSKRRERDRDKKRKKRNLRGDLLKQLQERVGAVNMPMNSTLERIITAVKAKLKEEEDREKKEQALVGKVPDKFLREGLRDFSKFGLALVNSDLRILEANAAMVAACCPFGEKRPEDLKMQLLRNFIHEGDERQLRLAASHVAQAKLTDEMLRRYVVGIRVRSNDGNKNWEVRPAEVVACGGNIYGHLYMVFLHPVAKDASPPDIVKALESYGADFAPEGNFLNLDFADEIDATGYRKACPQVPYLEGIYRLASTDSATIEKFQAELGRYDTQTSTVFETVYQYLSEAKALVEDPTAQTGTEDEDQEGVVLPYSRDKLSKYDENYKLLTMLTKNALFQCRRTGDDSVKLVWTVGGVSLVESQITATPNGEVICHTGERQKQMIPFQKHDTSKLKVKLLENGDIWFYHPEMARVDDKGKRKRTYLNVIMSRLPDGGLQLRRYPVTDGQTFSQCRSFVKSIREPPKFVGDCRTVQRILVLFIEWWKRKTSPGPTLSISDRSQEEIQKEEAASRETQLIERENSFSMDFTRGLMSRSPSPFRNSIFSLDSPFASWPSTPHE